MPSKGACLVVVSSAASVDTNYTGSVSVTSFIQAVQLLEHNGFSVEVATPNAAPPEFHYPDEASVSWLKEHNQLLAHPLSTAELIKQESNIVKYCGLVLPSSIGGVSDLSNDVSLGNLVRQFQSAQKPICAIGFGVTGLCKAFNENDKWCFSGWNLTAISNFETARFPYFSKLPLIIEDYIKDHGGFYNCSDVDETHIIIDRTLITGQNEQSTTLAVQNFIWLCSQ
ncbi:Glutamine amidotransferase-like class 1 domain-containing protein 1 [Balamuthia mandrillaris]